MEMGWVENVLVLGLGGSEIYEKNVVSFFFCFQTKIIAHCLYQWVVFKKKLKKSGKNVFFLLKEIVKSVI